MKIKYLIYLALFTLKVSGQGGQEIKMDLPTLSPQTPTTADLGKYGELQINESSGSVSESIPLFDFYAGKINIPITLNYSGNAVKVDQDPSWTGINWSLNAGGVITREVKDKPDEISPNDRQFPTEAELDAIAGARNNVSITPWFSKMQELKSNTVDNEVDIFNYNFLGYSGSFFLDMDYNAHLIKYDKEIAITFTYGAENKSSFTIATPDGNVFSFGGAGASESSKTFVNSGAGSATSIPIAQNAFYLTKIAFINGGEVNFIYQDYDQPGCQVKLGLQESASIRNNLDKFPTVYPKRYLQKQFERFISLKEIRSTFNDQHVSFDAVELNNCQGIVRLNNVFLKDNEDHILKQIQLAYTTLNNEDYYVNKFFLKRVLFFDSLQRLDKSYAMEYNNLEKFPKKYSFAQDELGYYNGKTNNVTTLPKLTDSYKWMNKYFELLADRSASLKHSQYGSLKKIIYPTGGSSQFEYELPFNKLVPVYNTVLNNLVYGKPNQVDYTTSICTIIAPGSGSAYWTYQQYISAGSSGGDGETDEGTAFSTSEINEGKLHITVDGTSTGKSYVVLSAVPTNTSDQIETVIHQYSIPSNTDPALNQVVIPFEFGNIVGNFFFKIAIKRHNADVGASIKVITELAIPSLTQFDSIYYPGLRVKRVRTNNGFSEDRITRFYYNTWANRAIESYQFHPNYVYVTRQHIDRLTTCPNDERLYQSTYVDLFNLSNNSTKSIFNNDAGKFIYKNVTVSYGGDNFENGGKELKYKTYANTLPNPYATVGAFCIPTGVEVDFNGDYTSFVDCNTTESFQNSILDQEEIFDNHHTTLKRTKYDYESEVVSEITNMKIYQFCTLNDNNLYLTYKTRSYKYRSKQITTTEFLNGNEITSIVSKDYDDDKVSLPKSISTKTSQGDEKVVKLYYPTDAGSIDGDTNYLSNLLDKHNLAEIVQTKTYLNDNLLESKRITFDKFNSNILPSKIQFRKGSNEYEDRLEFEKYTPFGSPQVVSKPYGAKIKYDYNAKEQVIAKTENTDLAQSNDDSTGACAIQNNNPSGLVTVYNYDPITNNLINTVDPKCDVINYEYDDFNRLIRVRDKNQNILSETKYNYQQPENIVFYNAEIKQVFHRNNCSVTYAVTDYVYTVDACKYSATSQAEADALAQAEMNTQGQIAADQFGNCGFANKLIYDKIYKNDCNVSITPASDAHIIPNDPNEPLPGALIPGYIYYGVPAGIYTSTISQDAVDELAQEQFRTAGQTKANQDAFCTIPNEFTENEGYLDSHNVPAFDVKKVGINGNKIRLDFTIGWLPTTSEIDDGDTPNWSGTNGVVIGTLNSSLSKPFSNKTIPFNDAHTGAWEIKINTAGVVNLRKITPLVFTPGGGYISLTDIQFDK